MRFTVGKKIGLGFIVVGLLILAVITVTFLTLNNAQSTLEESISSNKTFIEVGSPTVSYLEDLEEHIISIQVNINKYVIDDSNDKSPKLALITLVDTLIKQDTTNLNKISKKWDKDNEEDFQLYHTIKTELRSTAEDVNRIIYELLPDLEAKLDQSLVMEAGILLDLELNEKIYDVLEKVRVLLQKKNDDSQAQKQVMNGKFKETSSQFTGLKNLIIAALIVLVASTMVIALFTTRSITGPVSKLKGVLIGLGKGIFPAEEVKPSNDEIGEMTVAMNTLVDGLKGTTTFANEVGKSNFDYPYNPLSDRDTLGHALVKMRDELAENERFLERKVKERTAEVVRQKEEIERQSEKLEELYNDVTDSIRYAKRLQDSILPQDSYIEKLMPESFVLFKPKDIVSGDFYWVSESDEKVLFSAVDCTGHGVPGAFMSLIGANALNQIIADKQDQPAKMLNELNRLSSEALNKSEDGREQVRDGMDIALCSISKTEHKLEYSGANNPLYLIRNGEIQIIKADKFAIASFKHGEHNYTNHELDLQKGDIVYIFSDGYADQFGGEKGKKFMYRKFRDLLIELKDLPMSEQKAKLNQTIESWRGNIEQVDDILVIGVRIN